MAQAINGISGRCLIQFAQVNANGQADTNPVSFFDESQIVHQSSRIESIINKPKYATHVIQVRSLDYINQELIPRLSSATPFILVRVGIELGSVQKWLPYERHVILNDTIEVLPDSTSGPKVAFRTADLLWLMGYSHVRTHKGTISDMVSKLWTDLTSGKTYVEPCLTPGRGSTSDAAGVYYQSNDTDLDFIKTRLLPRALTQSAKSGYRFFVLDDVFHFHTPGFGQTSAKSIAYSSNAPMAGDLNVTDRSVEYSVSGGTGVATYNYDPILGVSSTSPTDPKGVAIFSNSRGSYSGLVTVASHIGQNLAVDETAKAQSLYATYRNEAYSGEMSLLSNIDVRLGDIVDLQVSGGLSTRSAYSGYWEVQRHVFSIEDGALTTVVNLGRGELYLKSAKTLSDPNTGAQSSTQLTPNLDLTKGGSVSTPIPSSTLSSGRAVQVQKV